MKNVRRLGVVVFGLSSFASGCAGRESVPLSYGGEDARNATEALSEAIQTRGHLPVCKTRVFCKFAYQDQGTVHFKLKKNGVVLAMDFANDELPPEEKLALQSEMQKLGQEIWKDASVVVIAKEKEERKITQAREAEERARRDEQRQADTAARLESERIAAEASAEAERVAAEERAEAERTAAEKVWDATSFERLPRGAALKVELPEGGSCRIQGDASWTQPKQLEIPFQIDAQRGSFYTFDCELSPGVVWHKKIQAKDGHVTVVRLSQGTPVAR